MLNQLTTVPNILCLIRLFLSPFMILAAWMDRPNWCLGLFLLLLLTDWLDGKLARILRQQTTIGAGLDSVADATFYASLLVAMLLLKGELFRSEAIWLGLVVVGYSVNVAVAWVKFRRFPTYHTRLAKTSWLLICIAIVSIFADWSIWPLRIALGIVFVTNIEEIVITFVLPKWRVNVPSVFHAVRIRRGNYKPQSSGNDS